MSLIGKNIKKIRSIKNYSQQAFADLFDFSRASVGAYEEGRAEPKMDSVLLIAKQFNLSVDDLLTKEITVNDLLHFDLPATSSLPKKTSKPNSNAKNISKYITQSNTHLAVALSSAILMRDDYHVKAILKEIKNRKDFDMAVVKDWVRMYGGMQFEGILEKF